MQTLEITWLIVHYTIGGSHFFMKHLRFLVVLVASLQFIDFEARAQMDELYTCSNGSSFRIYSDAQGDVRYDGYKLNLDWKGKAHTLVTSLGASAAYLIGDGFRITLWRYASVEKNGKLLATNCLRQQ